MSEDQGREKILKEKEKKEELAAPSQHACVPTGKTWLVFQVEELLGAGCVTGLVVQGFC